MNLILKVLGVLLVIFLIFYLLTRPEDAAAFVQGIFAWVADFVAAVIRFFSTLAASA